uniref:F-box associated beta-propeller type 1 domain-containing protein n=1 Tax=Quercus lobata TaxID=97700 RepID=A0A7N2LQU5_QUELO
MTGDMWLSHKAKWYDSFGNSDRVYERTGDRFDPYPGLLINTETEDPVIYDPLWLSEMLEAGFIRKLTITSTNQISLFPRVIQEATAQIGGLNYMKIEIWSTLPVWDTSYYMEAQPAHILILIHDWCGILEYNWYTGDTYLSLDDPGALAQEWSNFMSNKIYEEQKELDRSFHLYGYTDRIAVYGPRPSAGRLIGKRRIVKDPRLMTARDHVPVSVPISYCALYRLFKIDFYCSRFYRQINLSSLHLTQALQGDEHELEASSWLHEFCSQNERQRFSPWMVEVVTMLRKESEMLEQENLRCPLLEKEVDCLEQDVDIKDLKEPILFLANQEQSKRDADKDFWKSILDLIPYEGYWLHIRGCCHGLLCVIVHFDDSLDKVVILNPHIKKCKTILSEWAPYFMATRLAFGYYPLKDDYVVLKMNSRLEVMRYSLKSDSWKEIDFPMEERALIGFNYDLEAINMNGAFHWLTGLSNKVSILIFNLFSEKLMLFDIPVQPSKEQRRGLICKS